MPSELLKDNYGLWGYKMLYTDTAPRFTGSKPKGRVRTTYSWKSSSISLNPGRYKAGRRRSGTIPWTGTWSRAHVGQQFSEQ